MGCAACENAYRRWGYAGAREPRRNQAADSIPASAGESEWQPVNPALNKGGKAIRVVIAEDQAMVLGALAALLEIEGDIAVIAQSPNGRLALQAVLLHKPDVFITDIEMPEMTGLDVAAELKRRRLASRVIILTTFARAGYLRRALDAGASGYLLKDRPAGELAEAVRRVHQGLRVIDPELATEAWSEPDPLTDRERQVLRLAGEGKASGDIADRLSLSEGTVRNYLSEAISKLGAANRVEAARIARTKGWL
jgi:two-component system, NarL family, response regulator DesR